MIEFIQYLIQREPWMTKAACLGMGPDTFFPERGGWATQNTALAKSTCEHCPVSDECGDYADRTATPYGIWGGKLRKRYQSSA